MMLKMKSAKELRKIQDKFLEKYKYVVFEVYVRDEEKLKNICKRYRERNTRCN